jgi:protein-L-isoaspartate(D-aspartate) O-methyltransferase
MFVPDRAWCTPDDGPGYLIDRGKDPAEWLKAAYADMAIVTQLDDGATDITAGEGVYTSSLSAPSVILAGLSLLDPREGDRVLEIGTGTGWTAALLSRLVGDENVTTIEVDQATFAEAAQNLSTAGCHPRLVLGDGAAGWPQGAPYDRVHVTCGVVTVPYEWVRQTRPGGVVVFPLMAAANSGQLTRATVDAAGTATGYFYGEVNYMMLRAQRGAVSKTAEHSGTGITIEPSGQQISIDR